MFHEKIGQITGSMALFSLFQQFRWKVDLAQAREKMYSLLPWRVPLRTAGCWSWHFAAISPLKQLSFPPTPLLPQRTLKLDFTHATLSQRTDY
jgi:hypothetical protein